MTRLAYLTMGLFAGCTELDRVVNPQFHACVEMVDGDFVGDCEGVE